MFAGVEFRFMHFVCVGVSAFPTAGKVALLWPFGLGLYRLGARDAMFVRSDAADEAGLADVEQPDGTKMWQPADEFECWKHVCADVGLDDNWINLVASGLSLGDPKT